MYNVAQAAILSETSPKMLMNGGCEVGTFALLTYNRAGVQVWRAVKNGTQSPHVGRRTAEASISMALSSHIGWTHS